MDGELDETDVPSNPARGRRVAVAAAALAGLDLSRTENWVYTMANVDGAPLRVYQDRSRGVTCYFWRATLSCVRDGKQ